MGRINFDPAGDNFDSLCSKYSILHRIATAVIAGSSASLSLKPLLLRPAAIALLVCAGCKSPGSESNGRTPSHQ